MTVMLYCSANKSKFIKDRVTHVGKAFGGLCENFGAVARKNGKLRDKRKICFYLLLLKCFKYFSLNLIYSPIAALWHLIFHFCCECKKN